MQSYEFVKDFRECCSIVGTVLTLSVLRATLTLLNEKTTSVRTFRVLDGLRTLFLLLFISVGLALVWTVLLHTAPTVTWFSDSNVRAKLRYYMKNRRFVMPERTATIFISTSFHFENEEVIPENVILVVVNQANVITYLTDIG